MKEVEYGKNKREFLEFPWEFILVSLCKHVVWKQMKLYEGENYAFMLF